jgi:hypothetical protein
VAQREGASHALDQPRHQLKKVDLRVADNLKLVAAAFAVLNFEGLERHPVAEVAQKEMKPVRYPGCVGHVDRFEAHVLELELSPPPHLLVEAATAKISIACLDRAEVDRVIAGDAGFTGVALGFGHEIIAPVNSPTIRMAIQGFRRRTEKPETFRSPA